MGKKSRSISTATGSVASNNPAGSTTTRTVTAAGERSSARAEADSQHETRYRRLKRSLILMTLSCGIAMTDLLVLKEGVTVVMPDHKPLLAVGMIFGWLVWRRWRVSSKRGLHPIIRTLGFMVILAGCLAILPFNSTVTMLEVPLFTPDECLAVAEATAEAMLRPGFSPTFFLLDPSTEVPVQDLPTEVSTMVSEALRQRLMPFVELEFNSQGQVFLDERLYVEHYQAYHEPPPVAHVRQGQLALRVELDPPESKYVGGGGVRLESMGKTITPGMGSGLVLPAKLRHGSTQPGPNGRSVLVGTLTVRGRNPWQRFVGMWRLWGLFSRSVRYVADMRLSSSGVDSIPAPDPEPQQDEPVGEGAERLTSTEGDAKLDF
ncbi:unnamed protein product [Ectocarpus sp. 12 AP-2014]